MARLGRGVMRVKDAPKISDMNHVFHAKELLRLDQAMPSIGW